LELLRRYRDICLKYPVVAPEGATWANHRFDQPVLTLLAYEWEAATGQKVYEGSLDITTHHDFDDEAAARKLIGL
jgi:hypothetical protein